MEILGRSLFEDDEIHSLISDSGASTSAASFTALLELPPSQAVQLLHPPPAMPQAPFDGLGFSPDLGFFERAARMAVFAGSPEIAASNSSSGNIAAGQPIKCEPLEAETLVANHAPMVSSDPMENHAALAIQKQTKRKERGKKGNCNSADSKKKVKSTENSEEAEKLPYVHVRARRGQATDNHSLAERARREKINARMKLLQELVPGCNKISGTALVLDEIINHVQSLQRQVEFLSMRLAAVNPRIDFNLDSLLAADNGSMMENTLSSMLMPLMWQEMNCGTNRQPYQQQWGYDQQSQQVWMGEDGSPNFLTPDLSYDSGNSVSLRRNHVKMEMS